MAKKRLKRIRRVPKGEKWEFLIHRGPHGDEASARRLLINHGDTILPGISEGDVVFVDPEDFGPEAYSYEWLRAKKACLGVFGDASPFDEHATPGQEQPEEKRGHCCATLVARELGLLDDPTWSRLLKFVHLNDTEGFDGFKAPGWSFCWLGKNMGGESQMALDFMDKAIVAIHHHEVHACQTGEGYNPQEAARLFERIVAAWLWNKWNEETRGVEWSMEQYFDFVFCDEAEYSALHVAQQLKIDQRRDIAQLLRFVAQKPSEEDLTNLRGIPWLIWFLDPNHPEAAIGWAIQGLDCKHRKQLLFLAAKPEYKAKAKIQWVPGPYGKKLKVVTVRSDNSEMSRYARSKGAAVVIQKTRKGNVQIFTDQDVFASHDFKMAFRNVAAIIRMEEQKAAGEVITTDWKELRRNDSVLGAERWHLLNGKMLLNGTKKRKQPHTNLGLPPIKKFVAIGLDPQRFEPKRASRCKKGICTSTAKRPCPWYCYGLGRCKRVRAIMNDATK